jgi:hypothetical protein
VCDPQEGAAQVVAVEYDPVRVSHLHVPLPGLAGPG